MSRHILAIDQGTTGSTVMVVDLTDPKTPTVVGRGTVDFPQHYPKAGWVEHDLEEIWNSVGAAAREALDQAAQCVSGFRSRDIAAIGITNQRETLCLFDRESGRPTHPAIVWQCRRSADICTRLKQGGYEDGIRKKTGLVLDPYFTGTKVSWVMENAPEAAKGLTSGQTVCGTIDAFLIHRLTGGRCFATEPSNASRTLFYNLKTGSWDPELMEWLGLPRADCLPEIKDSAGPFGETKGLDFLPDGIPVAAALGDQQAAMAGQACFDVGEAKCTYGTGSFLLLNLGGEPVESRHGLLTTVAWSLGGQSTYAFEGASFVAGAAVQFLRDQLGLIASSAESETLAQGETGAPEVYFVPALAGLGAPHWDPQARGAFLGLTRGTRKGQLVRATLESLAFQSCELIEAMNQDFGGEAKVLRVDGGAAENDLLMQCQANFAGLTVDRPANIETTAFGAALFAALGVGIYGGLDELRGARKPEKLFEPEPGRKDEVRHQREGWDRAIRAVRVFAGTAD